jgi:ornithine carbamoyltransferase
MPQNLHGRSFLKLLDFSGEELRFLLRLGASLKEAKASGNERQMLRGKEIALIFEKDSTRTRSAFEVAAFDQGGACH